MEIYKQKLLKLLSRETSGGRMIPEIDGMRFLAISSVIYFHLWANFSIYAKKSFSIPECFDLPARLLNQGQLGVEFFFVISGFILGLPFARQHLTRCNPVSLKKYFKRRLLRLEPPYVINLFICYGLLIIAKRVDNPLDLWPNLLASTFYLHNLTFGGMSAINCVTWSLEIEVQFYILAPLLALVFAIPSVLGRRSLLIGGILAASVLAELALWKTESLINYIQYFLTGFLLVDIYLNKWEKLPPRSFSYDLFSGAALLALFSVGIMTSYYGLLIPWLTMLVIMGGFRGKLFNRFFTNPWIYTIGGMCYTIYLYHFFIIGFLGHGRLFLFHSFWPDLLVSFVAVPLAIVGVSSILFLLFEKPFMRRNWHSNLLTKWKCARGVPQDQEVASG